MQKSTVDLLVLGICSEMAVTKRRKFQEQFRHFKLHVDMTAGSFLLLLNSVGIKGAQHLAGASLSFLCLPDISAFQIFSAASMASPCYPLNPETCSI